MAPNSPPQKLVLDVDKIKALLKQLPHSLPEALKTGQIAVVINGQQRETTWETCNYRLDQLFAEDCICRDEQGCFCHITRGQYRMTLVGAYLHLLVSDKDMHKGMQNFWDLLDLKVQRILAELRYLWYVVIAVAVQE